MGQVPNQIDKPKYLIVGNGRVAKHLVHYFNFLEITFQHCTRENLSEFGKLSDPVEKILLLVRDDEIEDFYLAHKNEVTSEKIWIHCSGLLSIYGIQSAHPMASFTKHLFDLEFYESIPFVTEKGERKFSELFPEFPNPSFEIEQERKELYHAWCSIAGNFSVILWQHFFHFLENQLTIPAESSYPYLKSVTQNLMLSKDPLTGPIKRGDSKTIEKHFDQIKGSPLEYVYQSFLKLYHQK